MSLAFRSEAYEEDFSSQLEFNSPSVRILLERLSEPGKHRILDLGAPAESNVAFFSRVPCKLYVEDIHHFLIARLVPREDDEEVDLERVVADALAYDEGARFDLVLGWDLLNYMDQETIEVLLRRVARSCHAGTLLFLTGFTRATIPSVPARISIDPNARLRYRPLGEGTRNNPRYSPIALERMMPDFRLLHSFLLGEGMQEYLFVAG